MILRHSILVISDPHSGTSASGVGVDEHRMWESALRANKNYLTKAGLVPQWIVYSGDLASRRQLPEISEAISIVGSIAKTFDVLDRHVVVCPGNHDVDWHEARHASHDSAIAAFRKAVEATSYLHPWVANPAEFTTDGLLLLPIDTTSLIGSMTYPHSGFEHDLTERLPWWLRPFARRFLDGYEEAYATRARSAVGYLSPDRLVSHLPIVVEGLIEASKRQLVEPFLCMVGHHPLLTPPVINADGKLNLGSAHASLLKALLPTYGVRMVVQGHRHEQALHVETLLHEGGTPHQCVALSAPSASYDRAVSFVDITRAKEHGFADIAVRRLALSDLRGSTTAAHPVSSTSIRWGGGVRRCRSIVKHLVLDQFGRSTSQVILHGVVPCDGVAEIVHEVRPKVGRIYLGGNPLWVSDAGAKKVEKHSAEVRNLSGGGYRASATIRTDSLVDAAFEFSSAASHALSAEEEQLMFGEASGREATHLVVSHLCDSAEVIVEFPASVEMPSADSVRVDAVAAADLQKVRPSRAARDYPLRALSAERIRVAVWSDRRTIAVALQEPFPDVGYVLSWGLPRSIVGETDRQMSRQWARIIGDHIRNWAPLVVECGWKPPARGNDRVTTPLHLLAHTFIENALEQLPSPELTPVRAGDRIELSLQVCEAWPGTADGLPGGAAAKIHTVAAVVPDGFGEFARYTHKFAFGCGIVGAALRACLPMRWESSTSGAETVSYELVDDKRDQAEYILSVPIRFENAKNSGVAVTMAIYDAETRLSNSGVSVFRRDRKAIDFLHRLGVHSLSSIMGGKSAAIRG